MKNEILETGKRFESADGYIIVTGADAASKTITCDGYKTDENGDVIEKYSGSLTLHDLEDMAREWDGRNHKIRIADVSDLVDEAFEMLLETIGTDANEGLLSCKAHDIAEFICDKYGVNCSRALAEELEMMYNED